MGIIYQQRDIFDTICRRFTGAESRAPIYTASAPLLMAAMPIVKSFAGDNSSTFLINSTDMEFRPFISFYDRQFQ